MNAKTTTIMALVPIMALTSVMGAGGALAQTATSEKVVAVTADAYKADLVIDSNNYKKFEREGIHLMPGQIVEFKVDSHLNFKGQILHPALEDISTAKRTLYRARALGTNGAVTVENGIVIPFYGLWALSAISRDHSINVAVDKPEPSDRDSRLSQNVDNGTR